MFGPEDVLVRADGILYALAESRDLETDAPDIELVMLPEGPEPEPPTLDKDSSKPPWEEPTMAPASREAATIGPSNLGGDSGETDTTQMHFGDYELIEEVARGGMGVVYKARQIGLNRIVALKMILAGELACEEDVQRFRAEAEAAGQLEHPGIVPIHEIGCIGAQHFYTMSYIDGPGLAKYAVKGMKDPNAAARLVRGIAEAVDYAHQHGIVHRDLKPANVLLDQNGDPKITDFGLAKRRDSNSHLTRTGQIIGTPGYMAPEQAAGESDSVGAAADIYAIGAILYFTLTGEAPFRATNVIDTLVQSLESEAPSPRKADPSIPKALEQICMRCMERNPDDRYHSAMDVAQDLDCFLRDLPIQARPPTVRERLASLSAGHRC